MGVVDVMRNDIPVEVVAVVGDGEKEASDGDALERRKRRDSLELSSHSRP